MSGKEFLNPCQDNTVQVEQENSGGGGNGSKEEQLKQN